VRYHHSKNHNDSPAGYLRGPAAESGLVRLSFTAPPEASFNDVQADALVISPDGAKLVFTARNAEGNCLLWVRSLDSSDAKPLPGTDDAIGPFWSPDSRSVAFVSRGKLKRVDLAGGNIQQLCDAPRLTGGTWNAQGVILFGPDYQSSLSQVRLGRIVAIKHFVVQQILPRRPHRGRRCPDLRRDVWHGHDRQEPGGRAVGKLIRGQFQRLQTSACRAGP
jgi:hypothetical protein